MQVLNFHLFPYPPLPDELYAKSAWVTLSNAHYDEKLGHATYNLYLDQLELCDALGFDGVSLERGRRGRECEERPAHHARHAARRFEAKRRERPGRERPDERG